MAPKELQDVDAKSDASIGIRPYNPAVWRPDPGNLVFNAGTC
jgi:hypothetical protein